MHPDPANRSGQRKPRDRRQYQPPAPRQRRANQRPDASPHQNPEQHRRTGARRSDVEHAVTDQHRRYPDRVPRKPGRVATPHPEKDAEKYAPMPTLGWERAYRSGDIVVNDPEGLLFGGRADDQVKIGGRRIELGELDDQLLRLPGVVGAAAMVNTM